MKARREKLGLKLVRNLWTHRDDEQAVREHNDELLTARGINMKGERDDPVCGESEGRSRQDDDRR